MDLLALKAELLSGHPDTGAYSLDSQVAAAQINEPNRTIQRDTLSASAIFESIDLAEFKVLPNADRSRISVILSLGDEIKVNPTSKARAWLIDAFGASSVTRTALLIAVSEIVGRAKEIGLDRVRAGTIERARTL